MDLNESLFACTGTHTDIYGNLLIYLAMRRESIHGSAVQSTSAIEPSPCSASRNYSTYVLTSIVMNYHCSQPRVLGSNLSGGFCRDVGRLS